MTVPKWQDDAALEAMLADLPVHDAAPEQVERVREACVTALARRRARAESRRPTIRAWTARLETALATGLALLFLAGVAERTFEVLR